MRNLQPLRRTAVMLVLLVLILSACNSGPQVQSSTGVPTGGAAVAAPTIASLPAPT